MAEAEHLRLAREQLARVEVAWIEPVDWSDLSMYAFYALENGVITAADFLGIAWIKSHPSKVEAATELHSRHGLPDVSLLLTELNALRKSEAYGETPPSHDWSPEDIASEVERFIEAVAALVEES